MRITEQGHAVFDALTERGRLVVGALTDAARFVFGQVGNTYEKTGGATGDLEAGGAARKRKQRRKRLILYPQPRKPLIIVKSGSAQAGMLSTGAKQFERTRTGVASTTPLVDGHKIRIYAGRGGVARSRVHSSGIHTRIYAERRASGLLMGLVGASKRATYTEVATGNGQPRAHGRTSIIRGDDSEDLLLLGLEPEEDELLLLV